MRGALTPPANWIVCWGDQANSIIDRVTLEQLGKELERAKDKKRKAA
jgi:hypothetical protein